MHVTERDSARDCVKCEYVMSLGEAHGIPSSRMNTDRTKHCSERIRAVPEPLNYMYSSNQHPGFLT